ncbi:MAG: hypothetical protein HYU36_18470 [Planctomycetes bacterium]|nr:hypothetical protein [Planctomycetota bacterium]
MFLVRTSHHRRTLIVRAAILAVVLGLATARAEDPPTTWKYVAHELVMPKGVLAVEKSKEERKLFQVVEDGDTESGKALQVRVDKRLIRTQDIGILQTPALSRAVAPAGVYRVSVRLKLTGMLNCIGTPILFGKRAIRGYEFDAEDTYQEFSCLEEIIEPDTVTGRPQTPESYNGRGDPNAEKGLRDYVRLLKEWDERDPNEFPQYNKELNKNVWRHYGWKDDKERTDWVAGSGLAVGLGFGKTSPKGFSQFGFDGISNSIQWVTVDWVKVEKLDEPDGIAVRQVKPQKVWLRPGESQRFTVWLHNRTGKPQAGDLSLRLERGLNSVEPLASQTVVLESGHYRLVRFDWGVPKTQPMWGYRVIASFSKDGKTITEADEVFSIHPNPWAVMNFGGPSGHGQPYHASISYLNYREYFGMSPADSVQPFLEDPDPPYISGMGHSMSRFGWLKANTEMNHYLGIATFMYLSPLADSHRAELNYLKHPEWYQGRISWTDQAQDQWVGAEQAAIDAWRKGQPIPGTPKDGLFHIETPLNFNYEDLLKRLNEDLPKLIGSGSYDGFRGDGLPLALASSNALGEATGPSDPVDRKKKSAELLRKLRGILRAENPNFTWGSNGDLYGFCNQLYSRNLTPPPLESDPAFIAMFEGGPEQGGSLMDEGWMSAYLFLDPRNIIKDYFWACRQECDYCRRAGGFFHTFSPQRDGSPHFQSSVIYYNLLTALAGAQYPGMYSPTPGSDSGTAHFLTRFSEFLWDNQLLWLKDVAGRIRVDSPSELWFDETAVWRDLADGRRRYVIPLVNPPTIERFFKGDRSSELPEPIRQPFPIEVRLPEGFSRAEVWMLTAEPRTGAVRLEAQIEAGTVKFQMPSLILYRVIVVEFGR